MGGAGFIPFEAVDRYAERHGIDDPDEFDEFTRLIRALDEAYVAETSKRKS